MLYQDDSRNQFPPSPTGFIPGESSSSEQFPSVIPRFNISLEAPTAILDTQDEGPMTYINRGQYYTITLNDTDGIDGEIESTIILMFHDEQQRRVATSFWRFWLGQQHSTASARAIDIDKESSRGIHNIVYRSFDRITFNWIGKFGARIFVRFNCLSTDFSRIKGVKGIPLRIHVESRVVDEPGNRVEKSICRARIFRDKGAQRKAKDERRHIEKQIEKLRVENQDLESHPLWHLYTTAENNGNNIEFSLFSSSPTGLPEPILPISQDALQAARMQVEEPALPVITHVPHPSLAAGFPYIPQPQLVSPTHPPAALDIDPNYLPRARRQTAVLNIFIRFAQQDPNFRAVYLQRFTVEDLVDSICQKINMNPANIVSVIRLKGHINIAVDDQMVEAMREEQSMDVDYDINPDGSLTLLLSY